MPRFANLGSVTRLDVLPDTRSAEERRAALDAARDAPPARALLDEAIGQLRRAHELAKKSRPGDAFWEQLDDAYEAIDTYLEHLIETSGLQVRCGPRCSACCTDIVPAFAVEGLRMVRELKRRSYGTTRIQRAVEIARRFQKMLLAAGPDAGKTRSEAYRRTQLQWRRLGQPCPALDDDGDCALHLDRPIACRAYFSVEDPAHCEPRHPRFLEAERPPIWSHPREHEFEKLLLAISQTLGLPPTPNLPWALAQLHDHELAES